MVTRTFLSKCTTIINGSKDNFGLNPVAMLNYGKIVSRALIYFDLDNIRESGYGKDNVKHVLKLTNCGNIDTRGFIKPISKDRERATSFSVMAIKMPEKWDAGKGFDKSDDFWLLGDSAVSQDGANWYQAYNGKSWGTELDEKGNFKIVEGVYSLDFIEKELEKYNRKEDSIIVATQHFDYGNENFSLDITNYVNSLLDGEPNYGLCIMLVPSLERDKRESINYVGFFTNNTNTFFAPYVETRCETAINDDRYKFYSGKKNKLYFYAFLGGIPIDLDTLPICEIEGVKYPVYRQSTGVYYAEVQLTADNCVMYDKWSGILINEEPIDDVEMEFEVIPNSKWAQFGGAYRKPSDLVPSLSGINDHEKIYQGDERIVETIFKLPYTTNYEIVENAYYRLYVMDGNREVDVIDWDCINTSNDYNFFKIKTQELLPSEYHIDIKVKYGSETRIFKNKLVFTVVNNITELKK